MKIEIEKTENKGRYFLQEEGKLMGEITYTMAGKGLMIIDHTHVEEAYRGKGVGEIIVRFIVQDARESNIRILALCPFASAAIAKDETLQDVLS